MQEEAVHDYDDIQDKIDLINYEIKKLKKENMELHEQNQKTVSGIIKGCMLLEKAVKKNAGNMDRIIKTQKKLLNMVENLK